MHLLFALVIGKPLADIVFFIAIGGVGYSMHSNTPLFKKEGGFFMMVVIYLDIIGNDYATLALFPHPILSRFTEVGDILLLLAESTLDSGIE